MSEMVCRCGAGLPQYPAHAPDCPAASVEQRYSALSLILDFSETLPSLLAVYNKRYGGWGLPGGMVEPGETPEEAQRRELEEEAGIISKVVKLVYRGPHGVTTDRPRPGRASVVCIYLVEEYSGEPRKMEAGAPVQWMDTEDFVAQSPFRSFYEPILEKIVLDAYGLSESPR